MDCPIDHSPMRTVDIESDLPAFECAKCSGHWLRFGDYLTWRETHPDDAAQTPATAASEPDMPSPRELLRCPDCAFILTRYDVGHGVGFSLERCGRCNSVWLDNAEWSALRAHGLHRSLHRIFSPAWQSAVQAEERDRRFEERFSSRLGADSARGREFAEWVANHPQRSEILAYVQSRIR